MANGFEKDNSWKEWRNYVLKMIERLEGKVESLEDEDHNNKIEITKMSTKSKIYGSIAGFVVSAILSLVVGLIIYFVSDNIDMSRINEMNQSLNSAIEEIYKKG